MIDSQEMLDQFLASRQFAELWAFILRLNEAITDKKVSSVSVASLGAGVAALAAILRKVDSWVDDIPPVAAEVGRFGNIAYRTWHASLVENAPALLASVLRAAGVDGDVASIADELAAYLETSFGNETRIDYGTGHEAHFCLLLHLLERAGVFGEDEYAAVALVVFPTYLSATRRLQRTYRLEPAGSHGVWGLDDYSFLPFLWGSSQLLRSTRVKPTIIDEDVDMLREYGKEYLYLDAVAFIKSVKTGMFSEHSPMLYDVSRVRTGWPKINQGMLKMYKGEVWHKLQVMQMFLFGDLFPFQTTAPTPKDDAGEDGVPSTERVETLGEMSTK
jgi:serine/threonine-protein phosphatase 2A activator